MKDSNVKPKIKETVLITGASSGIGKALAYYFASKGNYDLVLIARRIDLLKSISNDISSKYDINVKVISKDLSFKNAAQEVKNELNGVRIDILINNAGAGNYGDFKSQDLSKEEKVIDLNITSLMKMTHLFLPDMIKNKSGKILNIGSIASFFPGPLMTNYYATKAYVLSFSEGLARELKGTGVSVCTYCPGPTRTDFLRNANVSEDKINKRAMVDVDKAAREAYKAVIYNKVIHVNGVINNIYIFLLRLAPRSLIRNISYNIQKKRR